MNVKEAYEIIKSVLEPEEQYFTSCVDFGEFWGFTFAKEPDDWCDAYRTVYKSDGHTSFFNPICDFELFDRGVDIPVEDVLNYPEKSA